MAGTRGETQLGVVRPFCPRVQHLSRHPHPGAQKPEPGAFHQQYTESHIQHPSVVLPDGSIRENDDNFLTPNTPPSAEAIQSFEMSAGIFGVKTQMSHEHWRRANLVEIHHMDHRTHADAVRYT